VTAFPCRLRYRPGSLLRLGPRCRHQSGNRSEGGNRDDTYSQMWSARAGKRCADGKHSCSAEAIGVATSGAGSSLTAQAFSSTIRASAAHPSGVEIQSLRSALVGVRTLTATSPSRGLSLSRYELVAHWWFHCSTMYGRSKAPGSTSSFWHLEAVAQDVNTFLVVVLIVLVGSAIFGFRGYWS
jgi:hypothetical protein